MAASIPHVKCTLRQAGSVKVLDDGFNLFFLDVFFVCVEEVAKKVWSRKTHRLAVLEFVAINPNVAHHLGACGLELIMQLPEGVTKIVSIPAENCSIRKNTIFVIMALSK
jgi:hypothetical protein